MFSVQHLSDMQAIAKTRTILQDGMEFWSKHFSYLMKYEYLRRLDPPPPPTNIPTQREIHIHFIL